MNGQFDCVDCGVDTDVIDEYYMVHDHVWLSSGIGLNDGMLCVGCLERRIGRTLTAADFTDAPINRGLFPYSRRLTERLRISS